MATLKEVLHDVLNLIPWPPTLNVEQRDILHQEIDQAVNGLINDIEKIVEAGGEK